MPDNTNEITVSLLDAKDNSELTTKKVNLKDKEWNSDEIEIENDWNTKEILISVTKENNSILEETYNGTKKLKISCCEHAIIKGDKGDLIKEINIRLAGFGEFGCPLPQDKFDDRTETAVKQFQRDYMKVEQTGIVCKDFLEKLDKFCEDYYIKIDTDTNFKVKCPCVNVASKSDYHCTTGFGKDRSSLKHSHKYNDGNKDVTEEKTYTGEEKPGIHRSLLWVISTMKFYLDKIETVENLKIGKFESSYRCLGNNVDKHKVYNVQEYDSEAKKMVNKKHPDNKEKDLKAIEYRTSNNHMGNAIDIHIYPSTSSSGNTLENADIVRKLFVKYCGALIRWPEKNVFCLEASKKVGTEFVAGSWVHIDCREFKYQDNILYCKNETELKGSTLQSLYSSDKTDKGKWVKISDCSYSPTAQTTIPPRVDDIWIGILNLPATDAAKSIKLNTQNRKWEIDNNTNDSKKRNQCVVDILEENETEYKVQPKGQSDKGWINKNWVIEVVKFKTESK